ncbi:MAG TPA: response regulator [Polyangia bacterium]|jgi:signal transduction histidine kinase
MSDRKALRILLVEDDENDATLLLRHLRHVGYDVVHQRVDTEAAMQVALRENWDLVLSDFSMPTFSAPAALAVLKEHGIDIPFIIISGTIDDEMAVDAMRAGAQDFLVKGRLARLQPAIERELREAAIRGERRTMQEKLLVSDRMVSVGTLAAGVAHEINNPLAALVANLDVVALTVAEIAKERETALKSAKAPDSADAAAKSNPIIDARLRELEEPLRDAREAADRVRQIVKDVKIFSRAADSSRHAVDVHRILDSSVRIAWTEIRNRAQLKKNYGPLSVVLGNESRLGQVFLNLIVNAAQAIVEGNPAENEITITTSRTADGRVAIEVRDSGSGIPETVRSKIFDAFFTTKPVGVGTGLGLSICHRLISEMGGTISVDSEEGKGTVFRVELLAASGDAAATPPPVVTTPKPARRGRVLVIDDEPMVATVIERLLSAEHDVTEVASARQALALIDNGQRFDILFTDLEMPEMTGMDLHAAVIKRAPDQADRMVFMSGGTYAPVVRDFLNQLKNPRIGKPFDVGTLRALVYNLVR